MQEPHTQLDHSLGKPRPMRFSGFTSEYFGIWLSNLLLSIITLGIYSAWAKVRRLQYFYNHTYLDDYAFGYHAEAMQILKGRVIVVGTLILLNIAASFFPLIYTFLIIILFFAIPYLINLSLEFNAKITSYRNLRFKFSGDYWEAFLTFQIMPILTVLSLGLLAPVAVKKAFGYVYNNLSYGGKHLTADLTYTLFYQMFLKVVVLPILVMLGLVYISTAIQLNLDGGVELGMFILVFAVYFTILFIFVIYRICCLRLVFNALRLDSYMRFSNTISSPRLLWILFSNLVAIVFTVGLAIPWAQVRKSRYLCDNIQTQTNPDFSDFIGTAQKVQSSIGEEFADFEGVELGL